MRDFNEHMEGLFLRREATELEEPHQDWDEKEEAYAQDPKRPPTANRGSPADAKIDTTIQAPSYLVSLVGETDLHSKKAGYEL